MSALKVIAAATVLALMLVSTVAADDRLDGPSSTTSSSSSPTSSATSTTSSTSSATSTSTSSSHSNSTSSKKPIIAVKYDSIPQGLFFCFTDNMRYGFCEETHRLKVMGSDFFVYAAGRDYNFTYSISIDGVRVPFSDGALKHTVNGTRIDQVNATHVNKANLVVELTLPGNQTLQVSYGPVRIKSPSDVAKDITDEENPVKNPIEDEFTKFTSSEWTETRVKWAVVGLGAAALALFAAIQKGHEEEEYEKPQTIGF